MKIQRRETFHHPRFSAICDNDDNERGEELFVVVQIQLHTENGKTRERERKLKVHTRVRESRRQRE